MAADRRAPIRPFESRLIQDYLGGRAIASAELCPAGRSNSNYKVTLADGEVCVLRLHARGNAARERHVMELARGLVPVPRVLAGGEDWTLQSFIAGEPLAAVPEHTYAAAAALARLSSLQFPSPGWIEPDGTITPFDFGDGKSFVASMLDRAEVKAWLGPATVAAIREMDVAETQRPAAVDSAVLVHGDFNPTNILIHDGKVSGILDWEFAHAGGREMDIGNLLRHTPPACQDLIQAGLAAGGVQLSEDWKARAEMVDLSSHLEFLTTRRSDEFKRQCVTWIQDFLHRNGSL